MFGVIMVVALPLMVLAAVGLARQLAQAEARVRAERATLARATAGAAAELVAGQLTALHAIARSERITQRARQATFSAR
ncbi:MAG: hypothetical protein U0531_03620 [Dehalococcoidia bacterium]